MKELKDKAEGGMLRWKTAFANLFHEMEVSFGPLLALNFPTLSNTDIGGNFN